MKKRFLPILLATTIAALSLSACASISVDPTYAYIEKSYEELFDELNENFDSETYSCTYLWNYPRDVECLVKKCIYANDETWSKNYTHFVAPNGDEMNFIWDGPDSLGTKAWSGESTLGLAEAEKIYRLYAWSNPLETMDGALKNYDKETIVSVNPNTTYKEGDYYELYDEKTYDKVIFKISRIDENVEGYAVYIDDYATMTTYQFNYLENSNVFDDTRALKVANSIVVWK